ncbi:MAG: 3-hydroxyacyl-CoA dehydrogenase NAD-binding domain-containing protein, partial [Nitrospinota bacterium]
MAEVQKVSVIGTGTMGSGIALSFARAGLEVTMRDLEPAPLERARKAQADALKAWVAAGAVAGEEEDRVLGRIRATTDLAEALEGVDFVLEAVPETLALSELESYWTGGT